MDALKRRLKDASSQRFLEPKRGGFFLPSVANNKKNNNNKDQRGSGDGGGAGEERTLSIADIGKASSLLDRIATLERENAKLREEVRTSSRTIPKITEALANLTRQVRESKMKSSVHENNTDEVKKTIRALTALVQNDANEISELRGRIKHSEDRSKAITSLLQDNFSSQEMGVRASKNMNDIHSRISEFEQMQADERDGLKKQHSFFLAELSRIEMTGDAKREKVEERFAHLSDRVHRALALLETRSRNESMSSGTFEKQVAVLESGITSNTAALAELETRVEDLSIETNDARVGRADLARKQLTFLEHLREIEQRVDSTDVSSLCAQIESVRVLASSQGAKLAARMSEMSERIVVQEERTTNSLENQRSAVIKNTKAIVDRHDAALLDQDTKRKEIGESMRLFARRIEDFERILQQEKSDRVDAMSSLGNRIGSILLQQRASGNNTVVPSSSTSRSDAVEEVLRVEIQERMAQVDKIRSRIEDLITQMSSSMKHVEEDAKRSHSSLAQKFETFSENSNRKMEALRNSTAQTVGRLAEQLTSSRAGIDSATNAVETSARKPTSGPESHDGDSIAVMRVAGDGSLNTWQQVDDGNGNMYFYNARTGESRWDNPYGRALSVIDRDAKPSNVSASRRSVSDAADVTKTLKDVEAKVETTVNDVVSRAFLTYRGEVDTAINDATRSLTKRQDEMEIRMVEARQERLRLVRQHRVSVDQHEASLSLYQRTLEKHADLVTEMDEESAIRQSMDSMLASVEATTLFEQSARLAARANKSARRVKNAVGTLSHDAENRFSSLFATQAEHASSLEDMTSILDELHSETEREHVESLARIAEMRSTTDTVSKKIVRLEAHVQEHAIRDTMECCLVGRLERDESNRLHRKKSTLAIAQMHARIRDLGDHLSRVDEKCEAIVRRDIEDEKAWEENLIHAQAILDGVSGGCIRSKGSAFESPSSAGAAAAAGVVVAEEKVLGDVMDPRASCNGVFPPMREAGVL